MQNFLPLLYPNKMMVTSYDVAPGKTRAWHTQYLTDTSKPNREGEECGKKESTAEPYVWSEDRILLTWAGNSEK